MPISKSCQELVDISSSHNVYFLTAVFKARQKGESLSSEQFAKKMKAFFFSSRGLSFSLSVPHQWISPFEKIMKKASAAFGERTCFELLRLGESCSSEAAAPDIEPCAIKLLRSLETVGSHIGKDSVIKGLADIFPLFNSNEIYPIPSVHDFEEKIAFPFRPITNDYKVKQTSLSLSSPTAFPTKVEISLINRYFSNDKNLFLRLKLGIFRDIDGDFWCETGCVLSDRTMSKMNKNLNLVNKESPVKIGMLRQSINSVLEYMRERDYLAGLDLTPAFFHIIRLSERLGGRFAQPTEAERYIDVIERSAKHTVLHRQSHMKSVNEKLFHFALERQQHHHLSSKLVSLLLLNRMVLDYRTDEALLWIPPRMIYRNSGL